MLPERVHSHVTRTSRLVVHLTAGIIIGLTVGSTWTLHGQDQNGSTAYQISILTKQLASLDQRVVNLEQRTHVKAPFEVTDVAGKSILKVEQGPDGPLVTVGAGRPGNVTMGLGSSGAGYIFVRRSDGTEGVAIGQLEGRPMGVLVLDKAGQRPTATMG